jgi:hypothetical protein
MMNVVAWLRHATMSAIDALNGPVETGSAQANTRSRAPLWILHAR